MENPCILNPINIDEALRYIGVRDKEYSGIIREKAEKIEKIMRTKLRPKFIFKVFPIDFVGDKIFVNGLELQGNSVKNHLKNCTQVIFLGATLSIEADMLIKKAERLDMTDALVTDGLAGAAIEQVCDRLEEDIHNQFKDKYFTWRFSPGYGDLPIEIQSDFINMIDATRRIGLTVTENNIMVPTKSVTAIIGLSDIPLEHKQRGCSTCNMKNRCPSCKAV